MVGNATELVAGTVTMANSRGGCNEKTRQFSGFSFTGLTRLELAASGVTDRHSNQLSYSPSKSQSSNLDRA